jgi:fatty acid desaturase
MEQEGNFENLYSAWDKLRTTEKVTFFTFLLAKITFITTVTLLYFWGAQAAKPSFALYIILVWSTAFLAVKNWAAYHMEDDPKFKRHIIEGWENAS